MIMKVLRASDYKQVPWKNDGGLTREICVQWRDESHAVWDWRISMAVVARSGPFSMFPGIDRSIAVLEGRGLKLNLPHEHSVILDQSSAPFSFSGEAAVVCEVLEGPTTDLNIMTARKGFQHRMQKMHCAKTSLIELPSGWNAIVANTELGLRHDELSFNLHRLDSATDLSGTIEVTPTSAGDIFLLNVTAV